MRESHPGCLHLATQRTALDLSSHVLLVFLVVVQKDNGVGGLREIASNAGVDPSTKIVSK
ncbi:hypothetical protein QC762_0008370 [Podospora pseudocomata]|uniref:Uncharacterized protein n=1 Tax=Podospora pseudocomata TaxID=2093779 RepID=A0ABR0GUG2_9PEZI|nr:hypothetical protein QC762_0008370 [Podospora pseudocomata]